MKGSGVSVFLHQDENGTIWTGSRGSGLMKFFPETGEFKHFYIQPVFPVDMKNNEVNNICVDKNGMFWLGTKKEGIVLFDPLQEKFTDFREFKQLKDIIPEKLEVFSLMCDTEGNIWIGTFNELIIIDKNYKLVLNKKGRIPGMDYKKKLPKSNIKDIYEDNTGIVWLAYSSGGVDKYDPIKDKFSNFYYKIKDNSKRRDYITDIAEDESGNLYFSTYENGLVYCKKDGTFLHRYLGKYFTGELMLKICFDDYQKLWMATSKGLYILDTKTSEVFPFSVKHKDTIDFISRTARALANDKEGMIWCKFDDSRPKCINPVTYEIISDDIVEADNTDHVLGITTDRIGNVIFTGEDGVAIYSKKQKQMKYLTYDKSNPNSLANERVNCIIQDDDNIYWIGTGKGMSRYNAQKDTFENFYMRDGLISEKIISLVGNDDQIWGKTAKGVFVMDKKSKSIIKNYGQDDNLLFYGGDMDTDKEGYIIIANEHGFTRFLPSEIKDNPNIPPVYFTKFELYGIEITAGDSSILKKTIELTEKIELHHTQKNLRFTFASLNYTLPEKNRYKYILEGYDDGWINLGNRNEISLTNLNPGNYTLKVKGSNNDKIWNPNPAELHIIVHPPWWSTWWFRISLFVFITGSALVFYFWRVSVLKARQRELEQKVDERTAELKEANTELEEKHEEIQQQNDEITAANEQLKTSNEEIKLQKRKIEIQKEEIESSRDQLERAFHNIQVLSEFGQKLTATFNFDDINAMIYDYVVSLMDTAAFGVGIYNERRKIIDFPYFMENGYPLPYFYKDINNTKSLSVRCFKNKEEIVINNLSSEYKKYLSELPEVKTSQLPESMIHIPLVIEDKSIGTLTVNSFKKNAYNQTDVNNLRTLASYISIALDNARAYRKLNRQQEQITGSIQYGKTIQQAMLPPKDLIDKYFENFILYRPKDIVSGDFYWFAAVETHDLPMYFYAVVDCTGHGVPGAFMSMIGSRLLNEIVNEIVNEMGIFEPAEILDKMDQFIIRALRQQETANNDGMDVCLIKIQEAENKKVNAVYAGAKRPLYYFDSSFNSVEGTRRSIGGIRINKANFLFKQVSLQLDKGSVLYLSSDGLVDQCNPQKKKFGSKQLINLLKEISPLKMEEQGKLVNRQLDLFQANYQQRDDITLVGIKI